LQWEDEHEMANEEFEEEAFGDSATRSGEGERERGREG
jgi:hypothetical protein